MSGDPREKGVSLPKEPPVRKGKLVDYAWFRANPVSTFEDRTIEVISLEQLQNILDVVRDEFIEAFAEDREYSCFVKWFMEMKVEK